MNSNLMKSFLPLILVLNFSCVFSQNKANEPYEKKDSAWYINKSKEILNLVSNNEVDKIIDLYQKEGTGIENKENLTENFMWVKQLMDKDSGFILRPPTIEYLVNYHIDSTEPKSIHAIWITYSSNTSMSAHPDEFTMSFIIDQSDLVIDFYFSRGSTFKELTPYIKK